jgi:hypothetical protein
MQTAEQFTIRMFETNPDFVFTVTRDFVRGCRVACLGCRGSAGTISPGTKKPVWRVSSHRYVYTWTYTGKLVVNPGVDWKNYSNGKFSR